MRILTLSSPPGGKCGIGDYNGYLTNALHDQGHQIELLPLIRSGDRTPMMREFQKRISLYDAVIFQFDGMLYGDGVESWRNFATLVNSLRNRPAIVIFHEGPMLLARRPLVKPWSPMFLPMWRAHIHRGLGFDRTGALMRGNAVMGFVHNEHMRQQWIARGASANNIKTIVFPLQPVASSIEPRPLVETDTVNLIMFGFVMEHKGYEIALNTMRMLPENYVLTIAGGPVPFYHPDRSIDAIHSFIETGRWPQMAFPPVAGVQREYSDTERRSMEARIKFTGHVPPEKVADIMNHTDIALAPYRQSNGSAVLADYVRYGRPTIASAIPAFVDFAERANCLHLVAPDAPFEFAHAIRELAMDFKERRRIFQAARAFAERHSFAALARQCTSILTAKFTAEAVSA